MLFFCTSEATVDLLAKSIPIQLLSFNQYNNIQDLLKWVPKLLRTIQIISKKHKAQFDNYL